MTHWCKSVLIFECSGFNFSEKCSTMKHWKLRPWHEETYGFVAHRTNFDWLAFDFVIPLTGRFRMKCSVANLLIFDRVIFKDRSDEREYDFVANVLDISPSDHNSCVGIEWGYEASSQLNSELHVLSDDESLILLINFTGINTTRKNNQNLKAYSSGNRKPHDNLAAFTSGVGYTIDSKWKRLTSYLWF